jgi:5,10-methylenetetrahydromethanopterin reductase
LASGIQMGLTYGGKKPSELGALEELTLFAQRVEVAGFSTLWMPTEFSWDTMIALAAASKATHRIELASAALPIFSRHPVVMAQEALSLSLLCDGRLTLGVGLSHKMIVEEIMGLSYDRPADHMREYLAVLAPLLSRAPNRHSGEFYRVSVDLSVPGEGRVPLIVSVSGEEIVAHACTYADGVLTWLTGIRSFRSHIMPSLNRASDESGRENPRVIVGLPILVTDHGAEARDAIDASYGLQGLMPSHRAMLDREGVSRISDIALVGSEEEIEARLMAFAEAGMTDFNGAIADLDDESASRTFDFLATWV